MTHSELDAALLSLNWTLADFCRATGLHRNTPQRWRHQGIPVPQWVDAYVGLLLDVQALYNKHLAPPRPDTSPEPVDTATPATDPTASAPEPAPAKRTRRPKALTVPPGTPIPARLAHHLTPR